jgi:uncharacterized protein (TIGR02391 family)
MSARQNIVPIPVTSGAFEFAIALACKDSYTIRDINRIFINCGAEIDWWCESSRKESSQRMTHVFGWFEGIRLNALSSLIAISRGVGDLIVADLSVEPRHKGAIKTALERLDGVVRAGDPLDRFNLHPKVRQSAGRLFQDGHYRMAVFQTYVALIDAVKVKSGRTDIDGTALMQNVFSPNTPVLRCSETKDEQQGFMMLFAGAVMAIRNPRGHLIGDDDDVDQALELLSLASMLFRVLDRATYANDPPPRRR